MKSKSLLFIVCLSLCFAGFATAEEEPAPKPKPEKRPAVKLRPAMAAPVRIFGGGFGAGPRVEFSETGPVVKGTVDKSEIEVSYTQDEMVRLSVVRSYSAQDPELEKKYPHLHKQLNNLATPMVEEKVLLKVEARKDYTAESVDALTKEHPELGEKYAQHLKMFEQMKAFKGGAFGGGGAIRLEVRPALPIRPAPPRQVEPKKAEPKKAQKADEKAEPKR